VLQVKILKNIITTSILFYVGIFRHMTTNPVSHPHNEGSARVGGCNWHAKADGCCEMGTDYSIAMCALMSKRISVIFWPDCVKIQGELLYCIKTYQGDAQESMTYQLEAYYL
jgi:hypothetical protein